MMDNSFESVKSLISQHLEELDKGSGKEEDLFIHLIAERVAELMESDMELFINHLYRMDVDERKVDMALSLTNVTDESIYLTMAKLIYQRQKQRLDSRNKYRSDAVDFWAED